MQEKKAFQRGRDASVAHPLRSAWGMSSLNDCLDLYFRQCSIEVSLLGAGLLAATLANAGTHPWTEQSVFNVMTVQSMLKVMMTCGM